MSKEYFVCPDCGFKQKSQAEESIRCHRCGRSYQRKNAKKAEKAPDQAKGTGFFRYRSGGSDD